jgi:mannose-6-phosphate isomerase-like protein (cupin superfamily)
MRRILTAPALLATGLLSAGAAAPPQQAAFVPASELARRLSGTESGIGYQLPSAAGYRVLMIQRTHSGDAEVHTEFNDTIIIERGHGRFVIGGQIRGNHEVQPGEWRGGEISAGETHAVSPGDLLLIPAGCPHQAVVSAGPFSYLTIKTPRQH